MLPVRVAADVFHLLLPSTCLDCGNRTAGSLPLCSSCAMRLSPVGSYDLSRAAVALSDIDDLTALWALDHGGPTRSLVHGLKYRGLRRIGTLTGGLLGRRILEASADVQDAIVPVPLHRTRLLERGYNQSEWIARGVARVLDVPVLEKVVRRRGPGLSQTASGREARSDAVRSAFEVRRPDLVSGLGIVLVDDVLTTGATASAVARVLVHAGARRIHLATVGLTRTP